MKSFNFLLVSLAVLAVLVAATPCVQAGYIFSYDWDNPNITASPVGGTGLYNQNPVPGGTQLNGQDGWQRCPDWDASQKGEPKIFTDGPGNSGNVLHEYNDAKYWLKSTEHNLLSSGDWYTFNSTQNAVAIGYRVYTGRDALNAGLVWDGQTPGQGRLYIGLTGSYNTGSNARRLNFTPVDGAALYGDTQLTANHWYDVVGMVDFSPIANSQSPTISYYYRDLGTDLSASTPAPEDFAGYVPDTVITATPMWAGALPSVYRANMYFIRCDRSYYETAVDLVGVYDASVIPEPSTLALLGMGLFGLLAYAWRKRK